MYIDNLSRKIRRRKIVLILYCGLLLFSIVLVLTSDYSPRYLFKSVHIEDISCHYARDNDALPQIDENFFPSSNSIFYLKTSCEGRLDSRQACAIESAARTHIEWEIHVLFSAPVNKLELGDVNIELLKLMKNVFFSRVHIEEITKTTPLETLVSHGKINRTLWPIRHTTNVLKFATLYKWGGVVLDLDTIVRKPLMDLGRNWAVKDNNAMVRSEAMAFYRDSVGTLVSDAAVRVLANNFDVIWGQYDETLVITDTLKEVCYTQDVAKMNAEECLDFEVHPQSVLVTLDLDTPNGFYQESDYNSTDIYIYHIKSTPQNDTKVKSDSIYADLAKRYCPIVFNTYKHLFGI